MPPGQALSFLPLRSTPMALLLPSSTARPATPASSQNTQLSFPKHVERRATNLGRSALNSFGRIAALHLPYSHSHPHHHQQQSQPEPQPPCNLLQQSQSTSSITSDHGSTIWMGDLHASPLSLLPPILLQITLPLPR